MTIIWHNHYVPDGVLEPDEFNRWQCVGYVWSKEKKFSPETNFTLHHKQPKGKKGYLLVPIARIFQKGTRGSEVPSAIHKFCCQWLHIDQNGLSNQYYVYGHTVEEVQEQIQTKLDKLEKFFKYAI